MKQHPPHKSTATFVGEDVYLHFQTATFSSPFCLSACWLRAVVGPRGAAMQGKQCACRVVAQTSANERVLSHRTYNSLPTPVSLQKGKKVLYTPLQDMQRTSQVQPSLQRQLAADPPFLDAPTSGLDGDDIPATPLHTRTRTTISTPSNQHRRSK